ncbi:MAG: acyl-CoA dehydrogenase family protein [Solirubrobacteraceae bacterium]
MLISAQAEASCAPPLFAGGLFGDAVDEYRARMRAVLESVAPLLPSAEAERRFPRRAIELLGDAGLLRERWAGGGHGDLGRSVVMAEELGYAGLGGIGIGISLHLEAVSAILTRFARTEPVCAARDAALDGRWVGCLATSEQTAGSDLSSVTTTLAQAGGRCRVSGRKWFVSPGAACDFALVLCRRDGAQRTGRLAPLALTLIGRDGLIVERTLDTVGMRSLGTARLTVEAEIEPEAIVARPGTGLLAVSWGLLHERLAIAAQSLGTAALALELAFARMARRRQFGVPLFDHQALRLRLADLAAQVELARRGVRATAAELPALPEQGLRATAAAKVTATRLATRVYDEVMHVFGGAGYVESETPLARIWRDGRIGRLGAGSDEVMWELVAGGLQTADAAADRLIAVPEARDRPDTA